MVQFLLPEGRERKDEPKMRQNQGFWEKFGVIWTVWGMKSMGEYGGSAGRGDSGKYF